MKLNLGTYHRAKTAACGVVVAISIIVTIGACAGPTAPASDAVSVTKTGVVSADSLQALAPSAPEVPSALESSSQEWLKTLTFTGLDENKPAVHGVENPPKQLEFAAVVVRKGAATGRAIALTDAVTLTQYEVSPAAPDITANSSTTTANVSSRVIRDLTVGGHAGDWIAFVVPSDEGPIVRMLSFDNVAAAPEVPKVPANTLPDVLNVAAGAALKSQGSPKLAHHSAALLAKGSGTELKLGDQVTYAVEMWDWESGRASNFAPYDKPISKKLGEVGYPCLDEALVGFASGSVVEIVCDLNSLNPDPLKGAGTKSDGAIIMRVQVAKN